MSITKASCHCGAVELSIDLPGGLEDLRRCNCSLCKRKGAIMGSAPLSAITVTRGRESLGMYQWNTQVAKHYFCRVCGVYTHHQRRSNPDEYGFNIGCVEGIDPLDFEPVAVGDGASM